MHTSFLIDSGNIELFRKSPEDVIAELKFAKNLQLSATQNHNGNSSNKSVGGKSVGSGGAGGSVGAASASDTIVVPPCSAVSRFKLWSEVHRLGESGCIIGPCVGMIYSSTIELKCARGRKTFLECL